MAINYFDSSNRYTDPVRYFKANDPYYYEVDNIPIKQLEENARFLKDQVDGLLKDKGRSFALPGEVADLDRVRFNELRPSVDGTDSKVRVEPGRYTARINDAYTKDPLQFITQIFNGPQTDETSRYRIGTAKATDVASALEKWQSKLASNATLMNGLFERVFVYGMRDNDIASDGVDSNNPNDIKNLSTFGGNTSFWPGFLGMVHEFNGNPDSEGYYQMLRTDTRPNSPALGELFRIIGRLEVEFIRRWRGVTRTSIVDVKEALEIDIPAFDSEDFYYFDESGQKQTAQANQRIDLVFIYSKAIDQTETTLPSYTNGSPRTITKPTLGIVKGAGLGVRKFLTNNSNTPESRIDLQSLEGVTLMLPNSSDELAEGTGFVTSAGTPVRGSFPSPDDLMNLAPLLAENLSTTSVALIGQSILPVAYVVVKSDASLNTNSEAILTKNDIIDIRPFFRTTELAYNERAGIAAATPQVSIGNPVVTEAHLDLVAKELRDDFNSKLNFPEPEKARIVGAGSVKGGMFYGVEGALATYVKDQFNATTYNGAKAIVEDRYGYAANTIPNLPDWDLARWCQQSNLSEKGAYPNDRVNYFQWGLGDSTATTQPLKYSAFKERPDITNLDAAFTSTSNRIPRLSANKTFHSEGRNTLNGEAAERGITSFFFVEKTIQIDRSAINWARDYFVSVQLLNCAPLSARADSSFSSNSFKNAAGTANIWVDKRENEFTIFVSWSSDDFASFNSSMFDNAPAKNREDGERYAGWCVLNSDIMTAVNPNGSTEGVGTESVTAGVAIYPSVSFQVYGVPEDITTRSRTLLSSNNPTLALV